MRPGYVSWKYIERTDINNPPVNSVTCKLYQAERKTPYSLLYKPSLKNDYTIFIVHIGRDTEGIMDAVSTIVKTPDTSFSEFEFFKLGDYYGYYVLPHKIDVYGFCLNISIENDDHKLFQFDNLDIFRTESYSNWGFPSGIIDFSLQLN